VARRQLIRKGLAARSYRDVIREAAMLVAVGTGDASFVATVDSLVPASAFAARGLAVYASRGDGDAMDRLVARLNDSRAYVRQWMVDGIKGEMPQDVIRTKLGPRLGDVKDAKVKEELEKVLAPAPAGDRAESSGSP
ncbi:MAG: hypothetical protein ACOY71_12115, partial [Gemmatimonadota bacterium]